MFWAKALVILFMPYPGLKAGVIENQSFMDFSPKYWVSRNGLKVQSETTISTENACLPFMQARYIPNWLCMIPMG